MPETTTVHGPGGRTAEPSTAVEPTPPSRPSRGRPQLGRFSGLLLFALVFALFAAWVPDTFLTATTFKTVTGGQAITAILALGLLLPLASGTFDLSAAQNLGFSALTVGALMTNGPELSPVVAILVVLVMGAAIGACNGLLVVVVGIDSFIATLGTSSLLLAGAQVVGNGEYVGPFPDSFTSIAQQEPLGIPVLAVYMVVLAGLVWYVLEHTPAGRRVYATGANRDAARLAGVPTGRVIFGSFIAAGVAASLAGILLAANVNSVSESLGPSYLLPAFAAAFLGATQLKPGRFNVWGTLLAIFLLGVGVQGLQLVGGSLWVTDLFNGVALLGAVSVAILVQRRGGRPLPR